MRFATKRPKGRFVFKSELIFLPSASFYMVIQASAVLTLGFIEDDVFSLATLDFGIP